ncbi:transposase [Streptomyces sp. NPDC051664]|uniref:transposase n=1 Tax=Streptomyces sp. NPDC051664 TaxID=3365668 RepID=UPI0037BAB851
MLSGGRFAFNIADGTVISELHRRHRAIEFKKFLIRIDKAVPTGLDVHLVCDNYATHNTAEFKTRLGKHPRFHVHFTPTGSSRMNQVERRFGLLTDNLIHRGFHTSVKALEKDITPPRIDTWNENPKPFTWTKTPDEILYSLADQLTKFSHSSRTSSLALVNGLGVESVAGWDGGGTVFAGRPPHSWSSATPLQPNRNGEAKANTSNLGAIWSLLVVCREWVS